MLHFWFLSWENWGIAHPGRWWFSTSTSASRHSSTCRVRGQNGHMVQVDMTHLGLKLSVLTRLPELSGTHQKSWSNLINSGPKCPRIPSHLNSMSGLFGVTLPLPLKSFARHFCSFSVATIGNQMIKCVRVTPYIEDGHPTITSWWFQPLWKILVKIGIFPK